jgi:hypothetical protein
MEITQDLKLKLLRGDSIEGIKPLKLKDIKDWNEYKSSLGVLLATPADFNIKDTSIIKNNLDIIKLFLIKQDEFVVSAFKMFISDKYKIIKNQIYINNCEILTNDKFDRIVDILKLQNFCEKQEKPKAMTKRAKELQKIFEERRKTLARRGKGNNLELFDYIPFYCERNTSGINILNIWDMTIYQAQIQFNSLMSIENFDVGLKQVLVGVNPRDIDFKHYLKK